MKKLLAMVVYIGILLSLTACGEKTGGKTSNPLNDISAADEDAFEYEYDSEYGGMIITDYLKESPKLRIPDTLEGESVVGVNLSKCEKELTHLYFLDSVIRISLSDKTEQTVKYLAMPAAGADYTVMSKFYGEYAPTIEEFYQNNIENTYRGFTDFHSLESISVTEKCPRLTTIDGMLFYDYGGEKILLVCPQGKSGSINLPKDTTKIGNYAFYNCGKVTSVTIPDSVENIENNIFDGCTSLNDVTYKGKTYSSPYIGELFGVDVHRVISADSTAGSIRDTFNEFLMEADLHGYGMKSRSDLIDTLIITVDDMGQWTVSGIIPEHFRTSSGTDVAWEYSASATTGESKSGVKNASKLFALYLAEHYPDMKHASIYAVLNGRDLCTFVAYTADTTESIADDVAADNLVAANGEPNKTSTWDSHGEGYSSKNGYIIGTWPKVSMA